VLRDDAPVAGAGDARRVDEFPFAEREELRTGEPGQTRPQDQAEYHRQQQRHVAADRLALRRGGVQLHGQDVEEASQDGAQDQHGQRDHEVGEAHQHHVDLAAVVASDGPDGHADDERRQPQHDHDQQRCLDPLHHLGEGVRADGVLPEGMVADGEAAAGQEGQLQGRPPAVDHVARGRVVLVLPQALDGPDAHADDAEEGDRYQDDQAEDGALVADEPRPHDLALGEAFDLLGLADALTTPLRVVGRRGVLVKNLVDRAGLHRPPRVSAPHGAVVVIDAHAFTRIRGSMTA